MNNKVIFAFAVGAAIGSVASWFFTKKYYERVAQEEIDSVIDYYNDKIEEDEGEAVEATPKTYEKPSLSEYAKKIADEGYAPEENEEEKEKEPMMPKIEPYVISPSEFGEMDEYETVSLTQYADGVITDEWGDVIEDVDRVVGPDVESHFGEYEDDSVFIRNDDLKTDYEILRDYRNYSESLE